MHPLHHWLDTYKQQRQTEIRELFDHRWPPVIDFLKLVQAPGHWGVFASIGEHYRYAIFGRDSIETAEELIGFQPHVVRNIILVLCRLQGVTTDTVSEEEPGKIHHEHRAVRLNGFTVPQQSQDIIRDLQHVWGGAGTDQMTYYGSHDTTPLFIRLVAWYVQKHGQMILDEPLINRSNLTVLVRDCVYAALKLLEQKVSSHPLGLYAYKRLNPHGISNQCWKDSLTSHIHTDGSEPNFNEGIVSIELQGYTYDAFKLGSGMQIGSKDDQEYWMLLANRIQSQTISLLWLPDDKYFAQGLDYDDAHAPRQIASITSDAGALLDSSLIHDLPAEQAETYQHHIARMLFGPDLLTSIGIRCRAVRHWDVLDYIDYHGPNTVWPKETFDIAKGLRRSRLNHLAADLERRIIHSLEEAGEFYEFFYVSRNGSVWYDRDDALAHFGEESPGFYLPVPEPGQAWTIAAALRIAHDRARLVHELTPTTDFEASLLEYANIVST